MNGAGESERAAGSGGESSEFGLLFTDWLRCGRAVWPVVGISEEKMARVFGLFLKLRERSRRKETDLPSPTRDRGGDAPFGPDSFLAAGLLLRVPSAWSLLHERRRPMVRKIAAGYLCRGSSPIPSRRLAQLTDEAEALVWERLFIERRALLRFGDRLNARLHALACWAALAVRGERGRPWTLGIPEETAGSLGDPSGLASANDELRRALAAVDDSLGRMADRDRRILVARFREGTALRDIASVERCGVPRASFLLHRAVARLLSAIPRDALRLLGLKNFEKPQVVAAALLKAAAGPAPEEGEWGGGVKSGPRSRA